MNKFSYLIPGLELNSALKYADGGRKPGAVTYIKPLIPILAQKI